MKVCKRWISVLCVTALLMMLLPVSAFAAPQGVTADGLAYAIADDTVTIIGYSGEGGEVIIPEDIDGYVVTSIGEDAFRDCTRLTGITIPDSVTRIGKGAFSWCPSLTNITIPGSVSSIGDYAFYWCTSLISIVVAADNTAYASEDGVLFNKDKTELICCPAKKSGVYTIPDSVTSIGEDAFYRCTSLTDIIIPDSVTSIGDYAFYWCDSLVDIIIPDSVTSIGNFAFSYSRLISITVPKSVTHIGDWTFSWCASLTDIIIPDSVTSIGEGAFFYCNNLTSITIPNSVTSIGEDAFSDCRNLTICGMADSYAQTYANDNGIPFVVIGESEIFTGTCGENLTWTLDDEGTLTISGEGAMEDYPRESWSGLEIFAVVIEDGVTSIGDGTFSDCYSLTKITLPNSITSIGDVAFANSNLIGITIPDGVTSIGDYAFYGCESLTNITIGNSVTSIGDYAFYWCPSLTDITIPDSVTSIGDEAFNSCRSLTSIAIPNSVTSIGNRVFSECTSLTSITIPNSITSIGDKAFYWCTSLTDITIPDSVTSIGDEAFSTCSSLTSITIPNSVTSIGNRAFDYCRSLIHITVDTDNTVYTAENGVLFNKDKTEILLCPAGKSGRYTIPDGVTSIGTYAFSTCFPLVSITAGDDVASIGDGAFYGCDLLTVYGPAGSHAEKYANDHNIPFVITEESKNLTGTCGDNLIWEFDNEGTLIISGEGEMRAYYAPAPWEGLEFSKVVIQYGVTSIGGYAFYGCESLTNITIPDSVGWIESGAFSCCDNLTNITIPDSVGWIGSGAFYGCESLTSITIPDSVTDIGDNAFFGCDNPTIYGITDSCAEAYANDNNIPFIAHLVLESNGVSVIGKKLDMTDVQLYTTAVPNGITQLPEAYQEKAKGYTVILHDIRLEKEGQQIDPINPVTVKIWLEFADMHADACRVYHVENDTMIDMDAVHQNGYMVFTTDQFGYYALVEERTYRIFGDVDGMGDVSAADALLALQAATGKIALAAEQIMAADVDGTPGVSANDALMILQYATQKIASLTPKG